MKIIGFSLVLGCVLPTLLQAQTRMQNSSPPPPVPTATNAPASLAPAAIVSRSANERVWARITSKTNANGSVVFTTNRAYIELATGISTFSTASNAWVDADPTINIAANGATATGTRHQVTFAGDAAAAGWATHFTAEDGVSFVASLYGVAFYDQTTGSNVLLGKLQSAGGVVIGTNEVVYSNVLSGSVSADLEYINTLAGLEQNLVIKTALPSPDSLNAGLQNRSTVLQIWTEFLTPSEPQVIAQTNSGVEDDELLDFGAMKMIQGRAFSTPQAPGASPLATGVHVGKQWVHINNRTFLIEQVPYDTVSNQVQNLPPHASITTPGSGSIQNTASLFPLQPRLVAANTTPAPMRVAKTATPAPGLVMDYTLASSANNYDFNGGTTYYVSGYVYLSGSQNVIEPGVVIKYSTAWNVAIWLDGPTDNLLFKGSDYRPSIFTSMYDNTVGESVASGTPSIGSSVYLYSPASSLVISHARFCYADDGIFYYVDGPITMRHCQFVDCNTCLYLALSTASANSVSLQNVLFANCNYAASSASSYDFHLYGENITADQCGTFAISYGSSYAGNVTNSIFTAVGAGTNYLTFDHSTNATSGTGIYQTKGNGNYYLATSSPWRGAGTTNLDADTLADLQTMTTYPPNVITTSVPADTTLAPAVARDPGISGVDYGYHYAVLDYVWNNLLVGSGVTLSLANGVAVGILGATGLIFTGGSLTSVGTPANLNYFGSCAGVQEEPGTELATLLDGNGNWGSLALRFTDLPMLGGAGFYLSVADDSVTQVTAGPVTLRDCQLHGGTLEIEIGQFGDVYGNYSSLSLNLSNNVFDGCTVGLNLEPWGANGVNFPINCYYNLVHDGSFTGDYVVDGAFDSPWAFYNNLFENTSLYVNDTYNPAPGWMSYVTSGNNGYINVGPITNANAYYAIGSGADGVNDQYPPTADYESGTLGDYYYPATGGNLSLLYHAGSMSAAAAGLYHYTVTTNNAVEGNNPVSIGFHYVATDGSGNPLDTAGDGLPDYLKDSNGDGVYDAGDLVNWLNPIYDQGVNYGGYYPPHLRLDYWRFDTSAYGSQSGQTPIANSGLALSNSFSGSSVSFLTTNSQLAYNVCSNTWTNFTPANGTIRFWFQPNWSNGAANEPTGSVGQVFLFAGNGTDFWQFNLQTTGTAIPPTEYLVQFRTQSGELQPWSFTTGGYNGVPISLQAGRWYQFALAYSPTNVALYTNGVLLATGNLSPSLAPFFTNGSDFALGNGATCVPAAGSLTSGFYVGNRPGQGCGLLGQLDELETFNYPLTAQAIGAGFPNFGGNSTNTLDTYYTGRSDMLQGYADGTWPYPANVVPCRLGYWRFDSPLLDGEQGQLPLSQSGVSLVPSWSGSALNVGSATGSQVTYADVSSSGWASINCREGSLRFWYKPNASGGSGPFVYMGSPSQSQEWGLWLNSGGSSISLITAYNGSPTANVTGSCSLTNTNWTQIVLTYTPGNSSLYINGQPVNTNGSGVSLMPTNIYRSLGMVIGNTTGGGSPINGQFEEMETFNYQLSASEIASNFQTIQAVDNDLNGIPDLLEDIALPTSKPFLGAPVVIPGTVEAEQFDQGGWGIAYGSVVPNTVDGYRNTGMYISRCDNSEPGYCLDQTRYGDWANYTINVAQTGYYNVETRVEGIGTNGAFDVQFTNVTVGGAIVDTGYLVIPTSTWSIVVTNVPLTAGTNVMKLKFLANGRVGGVLGSYVGRFDYISVYPWWQAGATNDFTYTNTITLTTGSPGLYTLDSGTNWIAATNNSIQIQNAVNALTGGGRVLFPSGTFMVAQANPNEATDAYSNAAVSILGSNIEIAGGGTTPNTILVAYNRATTIFTIGKNAFSSTQCSNITFRDMTLEAQPHRGVTNTTSTYFDSGQLIPALNPPVTGNEEDTGALVWFYEAAAGTPAYNLLVTNCQFLDADRSVVMEGFVSNVMVRACNFVPTGGLDTWGDTNIYYGSAQFMVGLFGRGIGYNLEVLENTYNGNSLITNAITDASIPVFATNLLNFTNVYRAADGLVFFQNGNAFIARNFITNNQLEAIQLNSGPNSVVGNIFCTFVNDGSCCALNGALFGGNGLTGTNSLDNSSTFVGNWVYGERHGDLLMQQSTTGQLPAVVNVSGNWMNLSPAISGWAGDYPGAAASLQVCQSANILGNTLVTGGHGVLFGAACTNALIMDNDFGSATYRGVGYTGGGLGANFLPSALVFRNTLGQGVSFHSQVPYTESFGWFFNQNTYYDAVSNSIPIILDPITSAAHVSN